MDVSLENVKSKLLNWLTPDQYWNTKKGSKLNKEIYRKMFKNLWKDPQRVYTGESL